MSKDKVSPEAMRHYLEIAKWRLRQQGNGGAIWENENSQGLGSHVLVPSALPVNSLEWRSVVERLAKFEERPFQDVEFRIENQFVDITRFRAANDFVIHESIPLTAGVGLVGSAYKMLRASATTARKPKAHISGGFSRTGDELVAQARLGQTERGSYILPIILPLTQIEMPAQLNPSQDEVTRVAPEPSERIVMRTLAQALSAIQKYVVEPATAPKASDMPYLVLAGASRELVIALREILHDQAVASFDASFDWASGITEPGGLPRKVTISAGAEELLTMTAKLLQTSKQEPNQIVSGPIVEVRHEPNSPIGEIALHAMRGGRRAEIRVLLKGDQITPALGWMETSRVIVVHGKIVRTPGKPLRIEYPEKINPLDEDHLPTVG